MEWLEPFHECRAVRSMKKRGPTSGRMDVGVSRSERQAVPC